MMYKVSKTAVLHETAIQGIIPITPTWTLVTILH
jgi:hypothetical protein